MCSREVEEIRNSKKKKKIDSEVSFSPVSPIRSETIKKTIKKTKKKRVYYNKVEFDETEFEIGDDVYVKRREDANSDEEEDPEIEDCQICFKSDTNIMIESATLVVPKPPEGKKLARTMREKLLSGDLWAARIEKLWKEVDDDGGVYWIRARWYMIPEETVSGRQPHNLKRELYLTNDFADVEMECILRHCFVKCPKEFSKATFGELADGDSDSDQEWNGRKEEEVDSVKRWSLMMKKVFRGVSKSKRGGLTSARGGANSRKGRFFGLEKVG
ncbi:unnamed protein product [Arabidopsis arenosa]|uniref:BAH domain-containing protein n=1 Tax=Arabidopsis arenosa TaxID=38785 RepID=A0A8S2AP66_ARAAE|nr:unnamed protein product [Arabidopsis arenosa]